MKGRLTKKILITKFVRYFCFKKRKVMSTFLDKCVSEKVSTQKQGEKKATYTLRKIFKYLLTATES